MAEFNRKAGVLWTGDLQTGKGLISTESRVIFELPYTYQTRFGDEEGLNPEELPSLCVGTKRACAGFGNLVHHGCIQVVLR